MSSPDTPRLRRRTPGSGLRWLTIGLGALAVLVLAPLGWYLLSPLILDRRVEEDAAAAAGAARSTVVARGTFGEVDAIHKGEGHASLARLQNGRYSLRFEGFRVTNGPDLYVYLSGHPAPRSSVQLHEIADLEVATLKGNVGDQTYELPADFDPARYRSVVVYCKRFTTVFSTAELRPA
jgi:hypothetical protein